MISQLHDATLTTDVESSGFRGAPAARREPAVVSTEPSGDGRATDVAAGKTSAHARGETEPTVISDEGVKDLVAVFKLLSDETRLRILLYLTRSSELHVRALCERLGQSQPAVSHHLALLRVAGLIESRRSGKHNFYHLLPRRFEQLLETVLGAMPGDERQIRFEDYVLRYAPEQPAV